FLIIPATILVLGAWLVGPGEQRIQERRRLLLLLSLAALALASLGLLIWTNPYGRELSSSIPAFGVLPVLVALMVMILMKPQALTRLWATDKAILIGFAVIFLILFGFLWLAEALTFYVVMVLTAALSVAWLIGTRLGSNWLTALSLVSVALMLIGGGGSFFTTGLEQTPWFRSALQIASGVSMLLAIFLSGAVVYGGLRGEEKLDSGEVLKRLVLVVLLISGIAYQVFWDGIWSAAHARAFEDHLPFAHFILSLAVGVVLAIALRGWRRLAGPIFVLLLSGATTLALILGWNVSAFELTQQRAAKIDAQVVHFYQDNSRYPSDLAELTPRYQLYLPPPVVVSQGGWCYQGDEDYYRLGYVSGQFTYFTQNFDIEVYAQAGEPPAGGWNCDEILAGIESGELGY
ncbi:MAG: hypothetical protein P8074_17200, partial [Anaerolineales bacterium]